MMMAKKAKKKQVVVHVATVHHRHGSDVFVDWTERGLISQLAEYAKDWWEDFCDGEPMPRGKRARVSQYFDAAEGQEWADITPVRMPYRD
jgi:hypothetical protein